MGVWIETGRKGEKVIMVKVTPFVGVWIETWHPMNGTTQRKSHPSWVCGLKQDILYDIHSGKIVTPFVGVWIETENTARQYETSLVTPFVGVWIETLLNFKIRKL